MNIVPSTPLFYILCWNSYHLTMNSDVFNSMRTKRPWLFNETWLMHDIRGPLDVGEGSNTYTTEIYKWPSKFSHMPTHFWLSRVGNLLATLTLRNRSLRPLNLIYHPWLIAQLRTAHIFSSCSNRLYMAPIIPLTKMSNSSPFSLLEE